MDICVLNPFFYPYAGGTERVLLEVYGRLAKKHNVTVISAALGNSRGGVEDVNGIRVVRLRSGYLNLPGFPLPMPLMWGLREAVRREACEVYHINNRYIYFSDTINAIKDSGGKMVLTLHDSLPKNIDALTDNGGYLYDVVWGRKMMHYADAITAVSRNTLDTTVPPSCRGKSRVIYNGVDYKRYRKRSRENGRVSAIARDLRMADSVNVVNNGRLVAQKGQVYLLEAMAGLLRDWDGLDLNILMIGRGYLRDALLGMAKALGMGRRLRITSGIDERMLPYYYNVGDVFVSASLYEPASLAVMEALASEVPVVATGVGGVPEMMGGSGLYAKPRSANSIKDGVREALQHGKAARSRARKGRRLMEREHDWGRIARQYEEVFWSALRR